jgi:hypothetical protein
MAIQINYNKSIYDKQLVFDAAYVQVANVFTTKSTAEAKVLIYTDSTKQTIIEQKGYSFTPDMSDTAPNSIKQGYEYIKTLDLYAGGVDC